MSIKRKIIISAVSISSISIIVAVSLLLWHSDKLETGFLVKDQQERLTSIRYFKSQQVTTYFKTIFDDLSVLATNEITVNALRDFSKAFPKYLSDAKMKSTEYKSKVIDNYLADFVKKYEYYNIGKTVDPQKILNLTSEDGFALQYKYIFDNPYPLSEKYRLNTVEDGSQYSLMHAKYHQSMVAFKEQFGFYYIFLVEKETANIVYTVNKEIDFTTSLSNGPYAKSNLGEIFRKIMASNKSQFIAIADFAPYLAFYDNQAAFIGTAIFDQLGNKIGAVIIQLSVDALDHIMSSGEKWEQIGLGKTVNSVIVGPDYKLRTNNRFFLENKEDFLEMLKKSGFEQDTVNLIKVKDSCIGLLKTDTLAVREAFAGKDGFVEYMDYRKIPVYGSFAPLPIPGLNWVIIVKIERDEVLKGVSILREKIISDGVKIAGVVAIVAMLLGIATANNIVSSIYKITDELNDIAQSRDLTRRLEVARDSEFTVMVNAFNNLIANVQQTLKNIQNTVISKLSKDPNAETEVQQGMFDLADRINDISKDFKILEDQNDRTKYW